MAELHGEESISRLFWFELELVVDPRGAEVSAAELVGTRAAIKIAT